MAHLNNDEYAAIGRVVVAFNNLENMLSRLYCIDYNVDRLFNSAHDQARFIKATKLTFSELLEKLKVHLTARRNESAGAGEIVDKLLVSSKDEYGRAVAFPLLVWRNALHHGTFTKRSDGSIFLEFYDREAFCPISSDATDLINGDTNKITNRAELLELEKSINNLLSELITIFGLNEAVEQMRTS